MEILILSLNHKKCPVSAREKLTVPDADLPDFYGKLPFTEKAALLTCNRREILVKTSDFRSASKKLTTFLRDNFGYTPAELARYSRIYHGRRALRHLFEVAAGLRSAVIGENQILGQVKDSYLRAKELGAVGKYLDRVFQRALYVGKLVRSRTAISRGGASTAKEAVKMAQEKAGLEGRAVLLIGAGRINSLTARYIVKHSPSRVWVINRTFEKASRLADELGLLAAPFEELDALLEKADVVFSATSAKGHIVDAGSAALSARKRPLLVVDLATPRDFHPGLESPRVRILNIDDVRTRIRKNMSRLRAEMRAAKELVEEELRDPRYRASRRREPARP